MKKKKKHKLIIFFLLKVYLAKQMSLVELAA